MIIGCSWPTDRKEHHFPESEFNISLVQQAISQIRMLRDKANIGLNARIDARIDSIRHGALYREHAALIERLARLENLKVLEEQPAVNNEALSAYFEDTLVQIDASASDLAQELKNLQKKQQKEEKFLSQSRKKLDNPNFLEKAPPPVISELKEKVTATEKMIEALQKQIQEINNLI